MNGLTIKYMERTYEELRSMSQEDLVRLVLELQDDYSIAIAHYESLLSDYLNAKDKIKEAIAYFE